MKPEDVGLNKDLQFFKPGNAVRENQRVTYTTVYKCDKFSVSVSFSLFSNHPHSQQKLLLASLCA